MRAHITHPGLTFQLSLALFSLSPQRCALALADIELCQWQQQQQQRRQPAAITKACNGAGCCVGARSLAAPALRALFALSGLAWQQPQPACLPARCFVCAAAAAAAAAAAVATATAAACCLLFAACFWPHQSSSSSQPRHVVVHLVSLADARAPRVF